MLQYLQQSTDFILAYTLNPLLIGIIIAFSAGVFEEGFRFLFKQFLLQPAECEFSQPLIFGLGHGIAEALMILVPAFMGVSVSQLGLATLERVLAIILHVTLTVVVWNGFQKKQRALYLVLAITIHGSVNSLIPVLSPFPDSVLLIEGALAVVVVVMMGYSYRSKKYYIPGRTSNEETRM
jgi:uncharacterized membrane protein YhfC